MLRPAMGRALRRGSWTPDEILLTLEAHLKVQGGATLRNVADALARELGRERGAVQDAIRAIANVDSPDKNRGPSRVLIALAHALADDANEVNRLAANVRELWSQRRLIEGPGRMRPS